MLLTGLGYLFLVSAILLGSSGHQELSIVLNLIALAVFSLSIIRSIKE